MLKLGSALVLLITVCCGETARAQARPADQPPAFDPTVPRVPRLRLSPLVGAALPWGEASPVFALREVSPPALLLGADLSWGPILPLDFGLTALGTLSLGEPDVCPRPSASCALASGAQLAVRARYFFYPKKTLGPWVSLGGGIDVLRSTGQTTEADPSQPSDGTRIRRRTSRYHGPLALFQVGLDWRLRRSLFLGALLGLGVSSYLSAKDAVSIDGETVTSSSGSLEPRLHQWLYLAANVSYDVPL